MARAKHKTIPKELKKSCNWLEAQGAKLVLGLCECTRHKFAPGHIRLLRKEEAGFKAVGYTGNGIMNFFIVCKNEEIFELVESKFGKAHYGNS